MTKDRDGAYAVQPSNVMQLTKKLNLVPSPDNEPFNFDLNSLGDDDNFSMRAEDSQLGARTAIHDDLLVRERQSNSQHSIPDPILHMDQPVPTEHNDPQDDVPASTDNPPQKQLKVLGPKNFKLSSSNDSSSGSNVSKTTTTSIVAPRQPTLKKDLYVPKYYRD